MLRTLSKVKVPIFNWSAAPVSSSSRVCKDTPVPSVQGPKALVVQEQEKAQLQRQTATIEVALKEDIGVLTGIPEEHIKGRRVRIYVPAKNAMQSGTNNLNHWEIEFDTRERWENPLMGWTSSGDPHSNLKLEFKSQTDAINYCEKIGFQWYLDSPKIAKNETPKSYGVNFSWNKRSRVSTK